MGRGTGTVVATDAFSKVIGNKRGSDRPDAEEPDDVEIPDMSVAPISQTKRVITYQEVSQLESEWHEEEHCWLKQDTALYAYLDAWKATTGEEPGWTVHADGNVGEDEQDDFWEVTVHGETRNTSLVIRGDGQITEEDLPDA